jgi:hypothetical protein
MPTSSQLSSAGFTSVDGEFNVWFEWGFILILVSLSGLLLAIVATASKNSMLTQLSASLVLCGNCIGGFVWILTGCVLRWRTSGMICSGVGNYATIDGEVVDSETVPGVLYKTGKFMQIYLIVYLTMSVLTCSGCVWSFFHCKNKVRFETN